MDLNRESIEQAMGWQWSEELCGWFDPENDSVTFNDIIFKHEWDPLHDLNQCFEVVEKLRNNDWAFVLNNHNFPEDNKDWYAEFHKDNYEFGGQVFAKTPNEAILKAALAVKKEKK
jgi:hypothetical protein